MVTKQRKGQLKPAQKQPRIQARPETKRKIHRAPHKRNQLGQIRASQRAKRLGPVRDRLGQIPQLAQPNFVSSLRFGYKQPQLCVQKRLENVQLDHACTRFVE